MSDWFYGRNGQQCGPISSAELKLLARNGTITPSTLIWKAGMKDWVEARRTKNLFSDESAPSQKNAPPPLPSDVATSRADDSTDVLPEPGKSDSGLKTLALIVGLILLGYMLLSGGNHPFLKGVIRALATVVRHH